eukprot:TRINITY_DN124_c0_g2_i1.p1 TRINITY_DN124_c0_g2~~TRINITY_DN124_c0_g2_i1.p1  ORF type:complete len:609 (+),score=226.64 TRINITY_DN124_c0_g2_i1:76-1827(+)
MSSAVQAGLSLAALAAVQRARDAKKIGGAALPLSAAAIAHLVTCLRRGQLGPFSATLGAPLRVLTGLVSALIVIFICRNPIIFSLIKMSMPKTLEGVVPRVGKCDPQDFTGFFTKMLTRIPTTGSKAHLAYYTEDATLPFGDLTFEWFVVNTAEYGTQLLQANVEHMLWPGLVSASAAFFGPKVLFILEGEQWKRLRRVMRGELIHQNMSTYADTMGKSAFDMTRRLAAQGCGASTDMYMVAAHYHLDASSGAMFSTTLDAVDVWPQTHKAVDAFVWFTNELPRRAFAFSDPALNTDYTTDNEDNRNMKRQHDAASAVVLKVVKQRLAEGRKSSEPDLLELMMRAYEEENAGPIDPDKLMGDVGANLVELIFAGFNTVTGVMGNAFCAIAADKEVVAKIRAEVGACLKGEDRPLTFADYVRLPYTIRCFHETTRRYSPSPVMARKIGPTDFTVGGVTVPKGTQAMVPLEGLAMDPRYWKDPQAFNPARPEWDSAADKDPESGAKWYGMLRGAYMPFSDGPRNCVGQNFAQMEYVMLIASVFHRFDMEPAEGYVHSRHFNGFGYAPRCGNTEKRGVFMKVTPRK